MTGSLEFVWKGLPSSPDRPFLYEKSRLIGSGGKASAPGVSSGQGGRLARLQAADRLNRSR
jgi:hypothetical protein